MKTVCKKIKVGVLGGTGMVGQRLIQLLAEHPWFELSAIVASERSVGQLYRELVPASKEFNKVASTLVVQALEEELEVALLFSCLPAEVAGQWEPHLAHKGYWVISNASACRMWPRVPLVVPEVNGNHLSLLRDSLCYSRLVTNPNCVVAILALALAPIAKQFGLTQVWLTSLQALSGAGYPGVPALNILNNLIPHIPGEEAKIEQELAKVLGTVQKNEIVVASLPVAASCYRVPVLNGHSVSVYFKTELEVEEEDILEVWREFKSLELPSSPEQLVVYRENSFFPQPLRDLQGGMSVYAGNLRKVYGGWQVKILGDNTIRGAAGTALLNAEYLLHFGII